MTFTQFVAAITGRRLAAHALARDDAARELAAVTRQLAAAQIQIAAMGQEHTKATAREAALEDALDKALAENERLAMQLKSERLEVDRLNRRTPLTGQPGYNGPLEPAADQDRRALIALQDRIDELLHENERLAKEAAR